LIFLQDEERNDWVDWFHVIPALATIPKTSNMASKLCIQLHAFPKDVFESIQKTQIVTGQDSEIISKLEIELRTLVRLIADVFLSALQQFAYGDFTACFERIHKGLLFC